MSGSDRADLLARGARHLQGVGDVVVDGARWQQLEVLEDDADVAPVVGDVLVVDLPQVAAGDADDALARVELLDQQAHDRRLARSGGTDQEDELLAVDRESCPLQADVARVVELCDGAEVHDGVRSRRAHRGLPWALLGVGATTGGRTLAITRARLGFMCRTSARRGIVRAGRMFFSWSAMAGHSSDPTRARSHFCLHAKPFARRNSRTTRRGSRQRSECQTPIAYRACA